MSIGASIVYVDRCENSMEWAKSCIDSAVDGAVFLAGEHGFTRGRQGRQWHVFDGQILLTVLLKPSFAIDFSLEDQLTYLSMACSLGVLDSLRVYDVHLKWPNDFVINHKKIGGMIIESVVRGDTIAGVVIGIGLNISTDIPEHHPLFSHATSLYMHTAKKYDIPSLQKQIYDSLDRWYDHWKQKQFDAIFRAWQQAQGGIGKQIVVHGQDGGTIRGVMKGVTPQGELLLEVRQGVESRIPFYIVDVVDI